MLLPLLAVGVAAAGVAEGVAAAGVAAAGVAAAGVAAGAAGRSGGGGEEAAAGAAASKMGGDAVAMFKYAMSVHKGRGKLEYRFVDLHKMEIVIKKVGGATHEKPAIHGGGMFVTYGDLEEENRYQMWIGQEWEDNEDSQSILKARIDIKKRSAGYETYAETDDVTVASSGKNQSLVVVPYKKVQAFLAQRVGYKVLPNYIGDEEEEDEVAHSEEEEEEVAHSDSEEEEVAHSDSEE